MSEPTELAAMRGAVSQIRLEVAQMRARPLPNSLVSVALHECYRTAESLSYWLEQAEIGYEQGEDDATPPTTVEPVPFRPDRTLLQSRKHDGAERF